MKKGVVLFVLALVLLACNTSGSKEERIVPSSNGSINTVSIVVDGESWKGAIGDAIREALAAPVLGLPQDEPTFSLRHIPTKAFDGFVRSNRTFLQIIKGAPKALSFVKDAYAAPQLGIVIKGETTAEIISVITANTAKIVAALKTYEIKESQRRNVEELLDVKRVKEQLDLAIDVPKDFRFAKTKDDFVWIRKTIQSGHMNILIYELPFNAIVRDSTINTAIVSARDAVNKKYIEGEDDGSFLRTERAFTPYLINTSVGGYPAYESRGTWEMVGQTMGGPYVNYMIEDKKNNRIIVLEGFVYAPRLEKRNYLFALEAILKSVKLD
jgi:hypothetical protein